ncbi:hypothetical protein I4F81_007220 [Pyropia yezoensis]|uniref:Uncharacterized protein n=1 Tax=Pyropia yezoensis TaxID=2788 RepID=A0ACC3C304_PYRYE|nr:hypothetical protein I4F81_007220 [Neopyropia yezoensis]
MPLAALASASNGAVIIAHGPTCGSASVLWLSGEAASAAAASAAAFAAPPPSAVRVTGAVALPGLDSTTPLVGAAFSADASTVAAVGDAKTVWLWHLAGGGGAPPRRRCLRPSGCCPSACLPRPLRPPPSSWRTARATSLACPCHRCRHRPPTTAPAAAAAGTTRRRRRCTPATWSSPQRTRLIRNPTTRRPPRLAATAVAAAAPRQAMARRQPGPP